MAEMVLTQNFKTLVNTILLGTNKKASASSNSYLGNTGTKYDAFTSTTEAHFKSSFKDWDGNETGLAAGYSSSGTENFAELYSSFCRISETNELTGVYNFFTFGSGTTPATENDYCLKNSYTSGTDYTVNNVVTYMKNIDGKTVMQVLVTVNALAQLSISEIGFNKSGYKTYTSSQQTVHILLSRYVLDTPVTLAAGESKTFEFTLSLF